ncbi:hypothetical protein JCM8547_004453 [Rhodosporidiobolus lusitaniae]
MPWVSNQDGTESWMTDEEYERRYGHDPSQVATRQRAQPMQVSTSPLEPRTAHGYMDWMDEDDDDGPHYGSPIDSPIDIRGKGFVPPSRRPSAAESSRHPSNASSSRTGDSGDHKHHKKKNRDSLRPPSSGHGSGRPRDLTLRTDVHRRNRNSQGISPGTAATRYSTFSPSPLSAAPVDPRMSVHAYPGGDQTHFADPYFNQNWTPTTPVQQDISSYSDEERERKR